MSTVDNRKKERSAKITYGYIRKKTRKMRFFSCAEIPSEITNIILLYYHLEKVVLKVAILGDSQIGKTTLMELYIEGRNWDDGSYISTLGVNFMEKKIKSRHVDITISVWDLGGQREFATLMPLNCDGAYGIVFMFDLTQKQTLFSVKRWYKEARKLNTV